MKTIAFKKNEAETKLFVIVLAQIIREGLTYTIRQDNVGWEIELTGGY
jgi:hypothetical protein